jgi:hypothetical protein
MIVDTLGSDQMMCSVQPPNVFVEHMEAWVAETLKECSSDCRSTESFLYFLVLQWLVAVRLCAYYPQQHILYSATRIRERGDDLEESGQLKRQNKRVRCQ